MILQVERDQIFPLLGQVQGILEKKTTTPIHSSILMEASKGKLNVFASGGELSFLGEIPCQVKTPGRFAVNGKGFFEILREIPSGELTLTEEKNYRIRIQTKDSEFHVFGLNPEDFLVFAPVEAKKFQTIPAEEFLDIVEKTLYCVSLDESRYHLTGVFCESLKKSSTYQFAATDGHRMASFSLSLKKNFTPFEEGIIIPRKGFQEIKRMISLSEEGESFEFAVEKSRLIVKFKKQILFIRLIDGKFPDYKLLVPKDKGTMIVLNKEDFLSALRRVSVLTNDRFRAVNFIFQDGKLTLEVFVPEVGEGTAFVNCSYKKKEELKARFNSRYILDVLNVLKEEEVKLFIKSKDKPMIVSENGNENYMSVVMPMSFPKE